MRAGKRWLCVPIAALLLAGCQQRRADVLESELRAKEAQYRELLDEQHRAENRVDALQREVCALRQGGPPPTPEAAAAMYGVRRITLGRGTGGYDQDTHPGDELLQVVVEPRDCDEHIIKAPGILQVVALEITPQGIKNPISSWEIGPEQLARSWKQGLLSTGYSLLLPWQQCPHSDSVRVVVRLFVSDGRVYEADKDVRLHVLSSRGISSTPTRAPTIDVTPVPSTPKATSPLDRPPAIDAGPELPPPRPVLESPPQHDPMVLPSSRVSRSTSWSSPGREEGVSIGPPQALVPVPR